MGEDGKPNHHPLNDAVHQLANQIWQEGGFRFRRYGGQEQNKAYVFKYYCSQNKKSELKPKGKGIRDVLRTERFECDGSMVLRVYLESRILVLSMRHSYHGPYVNIELDEAVKDFIGARLTESTPSQIYRDLTSSGLPRVDSIKQSQVYYVWQQGNASNWRRDADQFQSAMLFLSEPLGTKICEHALLTYGNMRGLALFVRESMSALHAEAKELAMDATFGTNNAGLDLFSVLAEVDGTGVALGYCFVGITPSADGTRRAQPGALTNILQQFLSRIRQAGFSPTFFGTDKDQSEINAVQHVWPRTTLQLCYWHAKRAIRMKLKDASMSGTLSHYEPMEALKLVPGLEICWGSLSTKRPDGDHRYGRCECPSARTPAEHKIMSQADKDTMLRMFCRHFNAHSLIPDRNGIFRSPADIHSECISEAYTWCKARGFFRLWAYLFNNWYCPSQWKLWARSINPTEIPVLKTTMMVESHWRRIKHDYPHQFNRPRIDLVAWILVTRTIPDVITHMRGIRSGGHRTTQASWRKPFKKEWKVLQLRDVDPGSRQRYHTDPIRFVCACEAFQDHRFLVCKHLVSCFSPLRSPVEFFRGVRRRRTWPFWEHDQLDLLPEFRPPSEPLESPAAESEACEDAQLENYGLSDDGPSYSESDCHEAEDDTDDAEDVNDSPDVDDILAALQSITDRTMEYARKQHQIGNKQFLERLLASNAGNRTLVDELDRVLSRRSMGRTWEKYNHVATRYYR